MKSFRALFNFSVIFFLWKPDLFFNAFIVQSESASKNVQDFSFYVFLLQSSIN